ncbi:MAG: hypothetical protein WC829_02240 [Hyphomicrobium sp.]|jgi:hypothetical protein
MLHHQDSTRPALRPRPAYPDSSRTLVTADARTRELAASMLRLNAEGSCTETLLLREGFSRHELIHLCVAATQIANQGFVRQVAEGAQQAPLKTDDELLAIAFDRCGGLVNIGDIVARLRGAQFTHDTIARLWPKLCARLARQVALLPIPGESRDDRAAGGAAR